MHTTMSEPPQQTPARRRIDPCTIARWVLVALAIAGWWMSLDLLRLGYGLGATNPLIARSCTASNSGASTCDRVMHSPYGSIPLSARPDALRLPQAAVGMGYFAFVGLWYGLFGVPGRRRRGWHLIVLLPVLLGGWESFRLTLVMATVLHTFCAGCLTVHAINALIVAITIGLWPHIRRCDRAEVVPHRLALAAGVAGLLAFVLHPTVVLWMQANQSFAQLARAYQQITDDPQFVVWDWQRGQRFELLDAPDSRALGPTDAPHTVVVFSDFACPACRQLHRVLESLRAEAQLRGRFRLVLRHFPLDAACNGQIPRTLHPGACEAALAAQAAMKLGGPSAYARMAGLLFDHPEAIAARDYRALAREAGLDPEAHQAAMLDEAVIRQVADDIAAGGRLGLTVTPGVFLDGRRVRYWRSAEGWKALLEQ